MGPNIPSEEGPLLSEEHRVYTFKVADSLEVTSNTTEYPYFYFIYCRFDVVDLRRRMKYWFNSTKFLPKFPKVTL